MRNIPSTLTSECFDNTMRIWIIGHSVGMVYAGSAQESSLLSSIFSGRHDCQHLISKGGGCEIDIAFFSEEMWTGPLKIRLNEEIVLANDTKSRWPTRFRLHLAVEAGDLLTFSRPPCDLTVRYGDSNGVVEKPLKL
jgi:hypothetical protein